MLKKFCFRYFLFEKIGKALDNKFGNLLRTPAIVYVNYLKIVVYVLFYLWVDISGMNIRRSNVGGGVGGGGVGGGGGGL